MKNNEFQKTISSIEALLKNQRAIEKFGDIGKFGMGVTPIYEGILRNQKIWEKISNIGTINTSVEQIGEGILRYQRTIGRFGDIGKFGMGVTPIYEGILRNQKIWEKISNIGTINTSVGQIGEGILRYQRTIEKFGDIGRINSLFSIVNGTILKKQSAWEKFLKVSETKFTDIDFEAIDVNSDGTINYGKETINMEETSLEILELLEGKFITIKDSISKLKTKHFVFAWIITFLLKVIYIQPMYYITSDIIKNEVHGIIEHCLNSSEINGEKKKIKTIAKKVKTEINKSEVDDNVKKIITIKYRFVTRENLSVHSRDKIKSAIIYKFKVGQVVKILRKEKNWTFVEYSNQDGTVYIKGWVLTRYLKKFIQ